MTKQCGNEYFLSKLIAKACVVSLPKGNVLSGIYGPKSAGPQKDMKISPGLERLYDQAKRREPGFEITTKIVCDKNC